MSASLDILDDAFDPRDDDLVESDDGFVLSDKSLALFTFLVDISLLPSDETFVVNIRMALDIAVVRNLNTS